MQWYYLQERKRVGPCETEELQALLGGESIPRDTQVWNASYGQTWKNAAEVPELWPGTDSFASAAAGRAHASVHRANTPESIERKAERRACRILGLKEIGAAILLFLAILVGLFIQVFMVKHDPFDGGVFYGQLLLCVIVAFLLIRGIVRIICGRRTLSTIIAAVGVLAGIGGIIYWISVLVRQ